VSAATNAGYATSSYDRSGVGEPDHPNSIQIIQAALWLGMLHVPAQKLQRGSVFSGRHYHKILGAGHSVGSAFTLGVSAGYVEDFDAVILTVITTSAVSLAMVQAAQMVLMANSLLRFASLTNGYMTPGTTQGLQSAFLQFDGSDLSM
jgi:hypothetical protein